MGAALGSNCEAVTLLKRACHHTVCLGTLPVVQAGIELRESI